MNLVARVWNLTRTKEMRKFVVKRVYWPLIAPILWPLTSLLIRGYGLKKPLLKPVRGALNRVHVIVGADISTGQETTRRGPDLSLVVVKWLREDLGVSDVSVLHCLDEAEMLPRPDVLVVAQDFMGEVMSRGPRGFFDLASYLRRKRTPAWVFPPDTFYLKYSTYASAIVAIEGGAIVLSQNSTLHGLRFGLNKPSGHHFWTWPMSEIKRWSPDTPWEDKEDIAYVASFPPGPRRDKMEEIASNLESAGYSIQATGATRFLSWDDYIDCIRSSKIVATETLTQVEYFIGPSFYRRKINANTITHRVLEGFATNAVVLTRESELLENLGFFAGHHYLAFPDQESSWEYWELPPDSRLKEIAHNGRSRFLELAGG